MLYLTLGQTQKDTTYHIFTAVISAERERYRMQTCQKDNMQPVISYHNFLGLNKPWQSTDFDFRTNLEVSKLFTTSCLCILPSVALLCLWTLILLFSPMYHLPKFCPFLLLNLIGVKLR